MTSKWQWMMDYCLKNRFPPAQSWAWNKAEEAYTEHKRTESNNDKKNKQK